MGFRFRLQRVLDFRAEMEKRALVALSETRRKRDEELKGLNLLINETHKLIERWVNLQGVALPMGELLNLKTHWDDLKERRYLKAESVRGWEERLKKAHERLLEAQKAKKALKILKEKRLAEFWKELNLKERKHLDEVSLRRFVAKEKVLGD